MDGQAQTYDPRGPFVGFDPSQQPKSIQTPQGPEVTVQHYDPRGPFVGFDPNAAPTAPQPPAQTESAAPRTWQQRLLWDDPLWRGASGAVRSLGHTLGLTDAPTEDEREAELSKPIFSDVQGIPERLMYRVGEGLPAMLAGAGALVAGPALGAGAGLTAVGGALTAGGTQALQSYGNAFDAALKRNNGDIGQARLEAMTSAGITGATGAASFALWPLGSSGVLKHLFEQTIVNGGLSAANQVLQNVTQGREPTEGLLPAIGEGVGGMMIPAGAAGLGGILRILDRGNPQPAIYENADAAFKESRGHYNQVTDTLKPQYTDVSGLKSDIQAALTAKAGDPRFHPEVFRLLDEIDKPRPGTNVVDFSHLDNVRQALEDVAFSTGRAYSGKEQMLAGQAVRALDNWMFDPAKQQAAGLPPGLAEQVAQHTQAARENWRIGKGIEDWTNRMENVDFGATARDKATANQMSQILRQARQNGFSQYPNEALTMMEDALHSYRHPDGFWYRADKLVSGLSPFKGSQSLLMNLILLGILPHSVQAGLASVGEIARQMQPHPGARMIQTGQNLGTALRGQSLPQPQQQQLLQSFQPKPPPILRPIIRPPLPSSDDSGSARGGRAINRAVRIASRS